MAIKNFANTSYIARVIDIKLDPRFGMAQFDIGLFKEMDDPRPFREMRFELPNPKKYTLKVDHLNVLSLQHINIVNNVTIHLSKDFQASNPLEENLLKFKDRFIQLQNHGWQEVFHTDSIYIDNNGLYSKNPQGQWVKTKEFDDWNIFEQYYSISSMNQQDANIIKNTYLYIKTLPEFSNAEDC